MSDLFSNPKNNSDIEEGADFSPRFDANGLISAIVQDADTLEVVMFAYMNEAALKATLDTGFAHYYSRSRGKQWLKGEESGHRQQVIEILADCDQDALVIKVRTQATGANCHTGRKGCFYRAVAAQGLKDINPTKLFDAKAIYNK